MQSNIGKIMMKDITIGIVAHVDAGKTTLSEAILYNSGKIRKIGRVDWRNTYLDTHSIEKDRGITVFSKQAVFEYGDTRFTLIDTPGHTDFTSETERSISILDYAILVISGSESVQSHTEEIWEMLERYSVPTFVFVTKMDSSLLEKSSILTDLNKRLSNGILEMDGSPDTLEKIAECLDIDVTELFRKEDDIEIFVRYNGGEYPITSMDLIRLIENKKKNGY